MFDFFVPFAVVLSIFLIVSLFYWSFHGRQAQTRAQSRQTQAQTRTGTQLQDPESPPIEAEDYKGLDDDTIDSYPTVVIGASMRIVKPDDDTCPICLSEYLADETLKILPECLHRFHSECLEQWLRCKATCPVCRINPPRSS